VYGSFTSLDIFISRYFTPFDVIVKDCFLDLSSFLGFFLRGERGRGNQERIKAFVGIVKRNWSIISFSCRYMYTYTLHICGESGPESLFLGG